jgi:hypothetical protein
MLLHAAFAGHMETGFYAQQQSDHDNKDVRLSDLFHACPSSRHILRRRFRHCAHTMQFRQILVLSA